MNLYKGIEGDTVPVELLVKSMNEAMPVKVTGVSASIQGHEVGGEIAGFVVKSDNVVHGLVGPDMYKAPGCYIVYVKCIFQDGSSRTFPVNVDIVSKAELTKQFMLDRWSQLSKAHQEGQNVVSEATRLLKSLEDGGYVTEEIRQQLDDMSL